MSFPALKNQADYERYKAIYLQTLQQQINNNATNYNGISLYQKTGQSLLLQLTHEVIKTNLLIQFIFKLKLEN